MPTMLVFGARNLGRAIARQFAAEGWNVAAVARSGDSLSRLASEVPGALTISADAGKVIDVERAFAETRMRFATVDAIVVAISPTLGGRTWGGGGVSESEPGSLQGLQLVVRDIEAAHADLSGRGVEVSDVQDFPWGRFVFFSDPDGNGWAVQQIVQPG